MSDKSDGGFLDGIADLQGFLDGVDSAAKDVFSVAKKGGHNTDFLVPSTLSTDLLVLKRVL